MTTAIKVSPDPATPGQIVDVDLTGLTPKVSVYLTTIDDKCVEKTSSPYKPRRSSSLYIGRAVPTVRGKYRFRVRQAGVTVAEFLGTVQ